MAAPKSRLASTNSLTMDSLCSARNQRNNLLDYIYGGIWPRGSNEIDDELPMVDPSGMRDGLFGGVARWTMLICIRAAHADLICPLVICKLASSLK